MRTELRHQVSKSGAKFIGGLGGALAAGRLKPPTSPCAVKISIVFCQLASAG